MNVQFRFKKVHRDRKKQGYKATDWCSSYSGEPKRLPWLCKERLNHAFRVLVVAFADL